MTTTHDFSALQDARSPLTGERVTVEQARQDVQTAQGATQLREQIREQVRKGLQDAGVARAQAEAQADVAADKVGRSIRVLDNGRTVVVGSDVFPSVPVQVSTGHPDFEFKTGPNGIPPQATEMAYGFFTMCAVMVVGWPIARAFGKRIERSAPAALPAASTEQLQRIEQAVEAMAIEVERISESQRFLARVQAGSTAERV